MGVALAALVGVMVPPATAAPGSATYKVGCGKAKLLRISFTKAARNTKTVIILNPNKKASCVYELPSATTGASTNLTSRAEGVVVQGNGATIKPRTRSKYGATIQVTEGSLTLRDVTVESNGDASVHVRDMRDTENGQGTFGTLILAGTSVLSGPGQTGASVDGTMEMRDQSRVTGFPNGGVSNTGTFTMSGNSRVSGNSNVSGPYGGGGVFNRGTMTMKESAAVSGNSAKKDSDVRGGLGGGIFNDREGHLTVQGHATVSDNRADPAGEANGQGGGIYNMGNATVAPGSIRQNTPTQCAGPQPVTGCTG
ncbi:hypothetical protein [Streptomyces finlayi]|uniref:Uncharacterized protein n=1 Tax=Streptomyces finlayi TaxID=67296 RepID=A0A7G7BGM2_9ACTN|nr:hypothetical protein [Streptomyces finlayi]QNE74487.1 hypothetical protein F0344_07570 [Streptomyces finlayi]